MITIVLGTRPEIIKIAPIIRYCTIRGIPHILIHSGQHYSHDMDRQFFMELGLPEPDINLRTGSGTPAEQTGKILVGMERELKHLTPDIVLVEGDTTTVLASALAAAKLNIRIGHVEAGLRSWDRRMPEEINRILTDHLSTELFAPTPHARNNLLREGISQDHIHVTGNTIVDAIADNLPLARQYSQILSDLNLASKGYALLTAHRQENVDTPEHLEGILTGMKQIHDRFGLRVIFPIHPRTRKMMQKYGIQPKGIELINPVGFHDFLLLEASAGIVCTDSGGVQEETCIIGVPCITLREQTERPETLEIGSNILSGTDPARIIEAASRMIDCQRSWVHPFGDGKAAERIVRTCESSP